jgi:hypothetical protein
MDAFELPFPAMNLKARYLSFVCTTTHFMTIAMTWKGGFKQFGHRLWPQGHRHLHQSLADASTKATVDCHGQSNAICPRDFSTIFGDDRDWINGGIAETLIGSAKRKSVMKS